MPAQFLAVPDQLRYEEPAGNALKVANAALEKAWANCCTKNVMTSLGL